MAQTSGIAEITFSNFSFPHGGAYEIDHRCVDAIYIIQNIEGEIYRYFFIIY